jgi:hypothetical protein
MVESGGFASGWKSYAKSKGIGSSKSSSSSSSSGSKSSGGGGGSSGSVKTPPLLAGVASPPPPTTPSSSTRVTPAQQATVAPAEIMKRAGLTSAEYNSLQPNALAALEKQYNRGGLTTTTEARANNVTGFRVSGTTTDQIYDVRSMGAGEIQVTRTTVPAGADVTKSPMFVGTTPAKSIYGGTGFAALGFGSLSGQLAVERAAGVSSVTRTTVVTDTTPQRVSSGTGMVARARDFFQLAPARSTNVTTTTVGNTRAGIALVGMDFYRESGKPTDVRVLTTRTPITSSIDYAEQRQSRVGWTFSKADEGLSSVIPYHKDNLLSKFADWRSSVGDNSLQPFAWGAGQVAQRPATTAARVGVLALSANPVVGGVVRLVGLGGASASIFGDYRRDTSSGFADLYGSPQFMQTVSRTPSERRAWYDPRGLWEKGTLTPYKAEVRSNLSKAGYAGAELDRAVGAAVFEKRTRQGQAAIFLTTGAEGGANIVGAKILPFTTRLLGKGVARSTLAWGAAIAPAGYYEGFVSSAALDVIDRRKIDYGRANKSGLIGAFTAGTTGAALGYVSAKFPKQFGRASTAANFLDAPYEQAGDFVSDAFIYGKYPRGVSVFAPSVTQTASEPVGRTYNANPVRSVAPVSSSAVSTRVNVFPLTTTATTPTANRMVFTNTQSTFALTNSNTNTFANSLVGTTSRVNVPSTTFAPSEVLSPSPSQVPAPVRTNVFSDVFSTTNSRVPADTITDTVVPTSDFPIIPPFGFGGGRKSYGRGGKSRSKRQYLPSLVAQAFKIRGTKAQKRAGFLTGIGVRPI